jgi:hypothetical protein
LPATPTRGDSSQGSPTRTRRAIIDREPSAIILRYLQTLTEIGAEQNTTVVFPLPLELLRMIPGGAASPSKG